MGSGKKDHYKGSEEERARSCSIRFIQRMVNEFKTEIKLFKKYKKQVKKNGTPIVYYSFSLFYLLELIFCGFMDWMRKHWVCWRIKRKEKKGSEQRRRICGGVHHANGASSLTEYRGIYCTILCSCFCMVAFNLQLLRLQSSKRMGNV